VADDDVERYWDERARENALFFVDSRIDYGSPDEAAFWRGGEEDLDRIFDEVQAQVGAGDRVLDIGCGVGRMTRVLAGRAAHVTGVDVSSEMLARAGEHNAHLGNVDWVHGDGRTLAPLADASFDGVFSHVVFQHLPDPEMTYGYVREIGRVLRGGGWAVFVVSTDPGVHRLSPAVRLKAAVKSLAGRDAGVAAHPAWRGSAVDPGVLRRTAEEAGLEVERLEREGTQYTLVRCRRRD
jgi:SAM-dependent methyltransferase